MKLSFAEPRDVTEVWGRPTFDANGLVCLGEARGLPPRFSPLLAVKDADGAHSVFGQVTEPDGSWLGQSRRLVPLHRWRGGHLGRGRRRFVSSHALSLPRHGAFFGRIRNGCRGPLELGYAVIARMHHGLTTHTRNSPSPW